MKITLYTNGYNKVIYRKTIWKSKYKQLYYQNALLNKNVLSFCLKSLVVQVTN